MSATRVRIRPLQGGDPTAVKNDLCNAVYDQGIKFSRIIPTGDTYVVVCLNEDEVDKLMTPATTSALLNKQFQVIIPPHLKAKKTVIVKHIDRSVTEQNVDIIKQDLEHRNEWATVEEIVKFPRMPNVLKVRFSDIKMANKATEQGISLGKFHLNKNSVELEDFVQLTPCWACYKYTHSIKDCPDKNIKKCSECAAVGHTFRECNERTNFKCLNCDGTHRTLAAVCPVRKERIKEIREQRKNSRKQFETENKTYCAVAKLGRELPKLAAPERPVLNLTSEMSFKAMFILIHAHLANIAVPGSFGATVKKLLRKNNLPEVELPDDAPSAEIFRVTTSFPTENMNINTQMDTESESEEGTDEEEEEEEAMVGIVQQEQSEAAAHPPQPSRSHPHHTTHSSAPPPPPHRPAMRLPPAAK